MPELYDSAKVRHYPKFNYQTYSDFSEVLKMVDFYCNSESKTLQQIAIAIKPVSHPTQQWLHLPIILSLKPRTHATW
jgi:hypothetical protein